MTDRVGGAPRPEPWDGLPAPDDAAAEGAATASPARGHASARAEAKPKPGGGAPSGAPDIKFGDPALESGDTGEYRRVDGPAFAGAPSYTDVDQGRIANCWLMGALASIAHTDPEQLTRMIRANRDGSFTVTFQERMRDGNGRIFYRPHPVAVQPTFPQAANGKFTYADPSPNNQPELWVALIEKAYAQWKGGRYEALSGGAAMNAMMAIGGRDATRTAITDATDLDALYTQLATAVTRDNPIALGSRDTGTSGGIIGWHTYAVVGVHEQGGERYVTLYNPFGADDVGASRHEVLRLADVRANFKNICIGTS